MNIGFSEEHLLDHRTTYSKLDRYWSRASAIGNGKTGRGKGKGANKKSNGKTDSLKEFINDVDNPIYMLKCRYLHALSSVLDHGDAVLGPAPGRLVHTAVIVAPPVLVQRRAPGPDRVSPAHRDAVSRLGRGAPHRATTDLGDALPRLLGAR